MLRCCSIKRLSETQNLDTSEGPGKGTIRASPVGISRVAASDPSTTDFASAPTPRSTSAQLPTSPLCKFRVRGAGGLPMTTCRSVRPSASGARLGNSGSHDRNLASLRRCAEMVRREGKISSSAVSLPRGEPLSLGIPGREGALPQDSSECLYQEVALAERMSRTCSNPGRGTLQPPRSVGCVWRRGE
jgi:hypothetical protein